MLSRRTLLALTALATLCAALAWPHRREILEALAPPESDYVEDQRLADGYGRASADLSAAWRVETECAVLRSPQLATLVSSSVLS